jgi:hypothetical protein
VVIGPARPCHWVWITGPDVAVVSTGATDGDAGISRW